MSKILCACTKKKCEGLCRKLHLHRKRDNPELNNTCPAAYIEKKKKRNYEEEF